MEKKVSALRSITRRWAVLRRVREGRVSLKRRRFLLFGTGLYRSSIATTKDMGLLTCFVVLKKTKRQTLLYMQLVSSPQTPTSLNYGIFGKER